MTAFWREYHHLRSLASCHCLCDALLDFISSGETWGVAAQFGEALGGTWQPPLLHRVPGDGCLEMLLFKPWSFTENKMIHCYRLLPTHLFLLKHLRPLLLSPMQMGSSCPLHTVHAVHRLVCAAHFPTAWDIFLMLGHVTMWPYLSQR